MNKSNIIAIFGKKAAEKLLKLLNPCCQLTFRVEATCVDGQICTSIYATSPNTQTIYLQGSIVGDKLRITIGGNYSFVAGQEQLLSSSCAGDGNPAVGIYNGFAVAVVNGEPVIGYTLSVDIPFCDA